MISKVEMQSTRDTCIMPGERTSLSVSRETRDRLSKFGYAGESFETVLNRVLDMAEQYKELQEKDN